MRNTFYNLRTIYGAFKIQNTVLKLIHVILAGVYSHEICANKYVVMIMLKTAFLVMMIYLGIDEH